MSASIILCAGKGTRMNDDSKNKVAFSVAGVPVIKRLVSEMKRGGVDLFVIVVGHNAESVKQALSGVDGVIYAYQHEQKGTGHATLCGLEALLNYGYDGPVIVSMGDKIVDAEIIKNLLKQTPDKKLVNGVVKVSDNPGGGRVVVDGFGKPYGTVELADVCLMAISELCESERANYLKNSGLNAKKAQKVLEQVETYKGGNCKVLSGKAFTAEEISKTPYSNAGLYRFDAKSLKDAISSCNSQNAQGEIYLTDTLEYYAGKNQASVFLIENPEKILTYSTKKELIEMSKNYLKLASEFISDIDNGSFDSELKKIYGDEYFDQKPRYRAIISKFIESYGDKKIIITRAPGRVNLMGTHIDHRGGAINVMAIKNDTVLVVSPRSDDTVNILNTSSEYGLESFSISKELSLYETDNWLDYINSAPVVERVKSLKGNWVNYVKSAVLRYQFISSNPLVGFDVMADGTIPVAAGLSSSSSIVVATAEAVVAINSLNLTDKTFVELCGEGEWYVGSRGGAGDHGAMKCSKKGKITRLDFKPFAIGSSAEFPKDYAVIIADSMIKSKKSENSKDTFNAKVMAYEFSLMLLKKQYPDFNLVEFRDIARNVSQKDVYEMLLFLPEKITREKLYELLPEEKDRLKRMFSNHVDPGFYDLRGVTMFGITECYRAEKFLKALASCDYELIGKLMKLSHDGDRVVNPVDVSDSKIIELKNNKANLELLTGAYGCSTDKIDYLSELLNSSNGVLGSKLTGAGLGGCVVAIVKKDVANDVISKLNSEYYDKFGFEHGAKVYSPMSGSAVIF
jgi:N-acetylgalactosamine kinase